jgi:hypothetical protein
MGQMMASGSNHAGYVTYGSNKTHCCGGNNNYCSNNSVKTKFNNDTLPVYLDEAILHRIAFTVWHTALHLERERVRDDVMTVTFAVGFSLHLLAVRQQRAEKRTLAYIKSVQAIKRTTLYRTGVSK